MSNCPQCDINLNRAHQAGSTWNYCTENTCNDIQSYIHQFCNCQGQFSAPVYFNPSGQCINGPGSLVPVAMTECYCCCDCSPASTQIATSKDDAKTSQDFSINDMVLVATDVSLKKWVQKPVLFSAGIGAHNETRLIKIHFGDQSKELRISPKQFTSKLVTQEQADYYYKILSTKPNNFIGKDGMINLVIVRKANADVIAKLLAITTEVADRIYDILSADPNYLVVTSSQPFLMKNGTMKHAEKLIPGKDVLVRKDGSTVPLIAMESRLFEKGIHHVSTSTKKAASLDGHLLLANGIVIGDYSTQISMTSKEGGIKDHYKNDPALGTEAYNNTNTHLITSPKSAYTKMG